VKKELVASGLLAVLLISGTPVVLAEDVVVIQDCLTIKTEGDYSLLSNKCTDTINIKWFYEGVCSTGCEEKLSAKYHKYVSLLKDPYTIAVCRGSEAPDPKWEGTGPPTCKETP
jgi:hypothetical protein